MARALVQLAEAAGLVLTVEQVNQQPPRMGNYVTVVKVRAARSGAAGPQQPEVAIPTGSRQSIVDECATLRQRVQTLESAIRESMRIAGNWPEGAQAVLDDALVGRA